MSIRYYSCLSCKASWGPVSDEDNISHGFCPRCLRERQKELVWRRQHREYVSDCYARGYDDCTEVKCAFWSSCLDKNIQKWEEEEGVKYAKAVGQSFEEDNV
jgi:hypothetical protein